MSRVSRTLTFIGLGKPAAAEETEEEKKKRLAKEAAERGDEDEDEDDEDEDDDEDDEDETKAESDDARKAVRQRNALRAAGHRRGVAAERARLAAITNDLAPGKVEMALHLAINTSQSAAEARATLDKMPAAAAAATPFMATMDRINDLVPQPGPGGSADAKGPSLSANMAKLLKLTP
jgi:hypothetical protein